MAKGTEVVDNPIIDPVLGEIAAPDALYPSTKELPQDQQTTAEVCDG